MSDIIEPSAFSQKERTARKIHTCCECFNEISISEKYLFSSGIWEGEPDSYKQCLSCVELYDDYLNKTGYHPGFGYLKEAISDSFFYKGYGINEYIIDYQEMKSQLEKLFKASVNV